MASYKKKMEKIEQRREEWIREIAERRGFSEEGIQAIWSADPIIVGEKGLLVWITDDTFIPAKLEDLIVILEANGILP